MSNELTAPTRKRIPYKWLALITVAIGTYVSTLNSSIVLISFPRLTAVFNTDPSVVLWVSVAYLIVSTSLTFIFGKIGDFYGRKKVYTIGSCIFTVCLALCAVSQNIEQLIIARVLQGIGSAMTVAIGNAIVISVFPHEERGKAIGMIGATVSFGLLSGPVLGGILVDALDWQSIFYMTIPVALAGTVMAFIALKEQKVESGKFNFDWFGALTLSGGLACLILFFNLGGETSFLDSLVLAMLIAGIILVVSFILIERKTKNPILDLSLFRIRLFAASNSSSLIYFIGVSINMFLMPFYFIEGLGLSAAHAGLLLGTMSLTTLVIGPFSGWLSDKIGYRFLCTFGMSLIIVGLLWLSRLGIAAQVMYIIPALVVLGAGSGFFSSPNNSAIMGSVPRDRLNMGSSMLATVRQIGISSGTAIGGAIFASRQTFQIARLSPMTPAADINKLALVASYQDTLLVAAALCLIAVFTSLARGTSYKGQL